MSALMMAAAFLLAGCEKESENTVDNQPVAVHITSVIEGMATRAAGTTWAANDAIGVTGISENVKYKNIKFVTTAGNGVFTPDGGEANALYITDKNPMEFTAYYPYTGTNGTPAGEIQVFTDDQSPAAQAKYDFLFARATGSSTNPDVKFQFKHCMSRLVLNFLPSEGVASLDDLTYSLKSFYTEGTFHTGTGEAEAATTALQKEISGTVSYNQNGMSSSLILLPQQTMQVNITVTMRGTDYTAAFDLPENPANGNVRELLAGHSYTYNVKINNTAINISPATIKNWDNGGGKDIDLD